MTFHISLLKYAVFLKHAGLCFAFLFLSACQYSQEDADLIIKNVTIIDALGGKVADRDVVIIAESIVAVAPSSEKAAYTSGQIIDGRGKFLIPGLWDSHVHLSFEPALGERLFDLFLGNGITSVRDTGGTLENMLAWRKKAQASLSPTVYMAGPLIDGKLTVYNGELPGYPEIGVSAQSPEEVVALVDSLAEQGMDLIKAYEMLDPLTFKALIKRADFHGLPVTGHVPLSMTVADASNAGMKSMEHFRNLEMGCSAERDALYEQRQALLKNEDALPGAKLRGAIHVAQHSKAVETYDPERCDKLLQTLASNQTWQIPTLALMLAAKFPFYAEDQWRDTFNHLPAGIAGKWFQETARFKAQLSNTSPAREKRKAVAEWKMTLIGKLRELDIPIMAGTDTPIFYLTPGFSLHLELQTLVRAGLTPLEAIETATYAPAKYFGKEDRLGLVATGHHADLLLLNSNPLQNISNTRDIHAVIKNGQVLNTAALKRMLKRTRLESDFDH